jgi:hypothetical protein
MRALLCPNAQSTGDGNFGGILAVCGYLFGTLLIHDRRATGLHFGVAETPSPHSPFSRLTKPFRDSARQLIVCRHRMPGVSVTLTLS